MVIEVEDVGILLRVVEKNMGNILIRVSMRWCYIKNGHGILV